jgi:hypothetical protein
MCIQKPPSIALTLENKMCCTPRGKPFINSCSLENYKMNHTEEIDYMNVICVGKHSDNHLTLSNMGKHTPKGKILSVFCVWKPPVNHVTSVGMREHTTERHTSRLERKETLSLKWIMELLYLQCIFKTIRSCFIWYTCWVFNHYEHSPKHQARLQPRFGEVIGITK